MAIRIFWHIFERQDAVPWIERVQFLHHALLRELIATVNDAAMSWQQWEPTLDHWLGLSAEDGPIRPGDEGGGAMTSVWRALKRPDNDPTGMRKIVKLAVGLYQGWGAREEEEAARTAPKEDARKKMQADHRESWVYKRQQEKAERMRATPEGLRGLLRVIDNCLRDHIKHGTEPAPFLIEQQREYRQRLKEMSA
jgi:hypothetical protein